MVIFRYFFGRFCKWCIYTPTKQTSYILLYAEHFHFHFSLTGCWNFSIPKWYIIIVLQVWETILLNFSSNSRYMINHIVPQMINKYASHFMYCVSINFLFRALMKIYNLSITFSPTHRYLSWQQSFLDGAFSMTTD